MDLFQQFHDTIVGAVCLGLVQQAYFFNDKLKESANAIYLKFDEGRFARFGIEGAVFFWRETSWVEMITVAGPNHAYPLTDIGAEYGLVGQRVVSADFGNMSDGTSRLVLTFDSGAQLCLVDEEWSTRLEFFPAHAG